MNHKSLMITCMAVIGTLAHADDPDNRITNSGFDSDLSGWDGGSSVNWDVEDANGSDSSGSLQVQVGGDIPVGASQCVAVEDLVALSVAIDSRQVTGDNGVAAVSLTWYSEPECAPDAYLSGAYDPFDLNGAWQAFRVEHVPPGSASSVDVFVGALSVSGTVTARIDNVYAGTAKLFWDRFETP